MTSLDTIREQVARYETDRPRALQVESGASQVFGCRAESVLRLTGEEVTDPEHSWSWQSFVGSAIHDRLAATAPEEDLAEYTVTYRGIRATLDRYLKDTATVLDYKSKDDRADCREAVRDGVTIEHRYQVHVCAAGLQEQGYQVDRVEVLYVPRSGSLDGAELWGEPFSQELADEGAAWLLAEQERADAVALGQYDDTDDELDGLRDKPIAFCRSWCPFVTRCRGDEAEGTAIPDEYAEQYAELARRHADARRRELEAEEERKAIARELDGISGVANGWRITWSGGNLKSREVVDAKRRDTMYKVTIGELPKRTESYYSSRSLRITPPKGTK